MSVPWLLWPVLILETAVRAELIPDGPSRAPAAAARPYVSAPVLTPAYRRLIRRLRDDPARTDRYDSLILRHAERHRLSPRLVKAVIAAESEFHAGALSPKGARGLMQLMPATARGLGVDPRGLHDPEQNIGAGTAYLAGLFRALERGDKPAPPWRVQRALAAYHAGPRYLRAERWPAETRLYVRRVLLLHQSEACLLRGGRAATPVN